MSTDNGVCIPICGEQLRRYGTVCSTHYGFYSQVESVAANPPHRHGARGRSNSQRVSLDAV